LRLAPASPVHILGTSSGPRTGVLTILTCNPHLGPVSNSYYDPIAPKASPLHLNSRMSNACRRGPLTHVPSGDPNPGITTRDLENFLVPPLCTANPACIVARFLLRRHCLQYYPNAARANGYPWYTCTTQLNSSTPGTHNILSCAPVHHSNDVAVESCGTKHVPPKHVFYIKGNSVPGILLMPSYSHADMYQCIPPTSRHFHRSS
jgi:hypothetical protein